MDTGSTASAHPIEEKRDLPLDTTKFPTGWQPALADAGRRRLLSLLGRGAGGALLGGAMASVLTTPAGADAPLDLRILQTASSLEALAVAVYGIVLGEGPDGPTATAAVVLAGVAGVGARTTLASFAREARRQHAEHRTAFQARTAALGGKIQGAPNPKFVPLLAVADLSTPAGLVAFLATVEKVVTDTYLLHLSMLIDRESKALMTGVMAVGAQRLATLLVVGALMAAGAEALVTFALPTSELVKVPGLVGSVAFPEALHQVGGPELVAEPASGALA